MHRIHNEARSTAGSHDDADEVVAVFHAHWTSRHCHSTQRAACMNLLLETVAVAHRTVIVCARLRVITGSRFGLLCQDNVAGRVNPVRSAISIPGALTTYYELLGVPQNAELAAIKAAFRQVGATWVQHLRQAQGACKQGHLVCQVRGCLRGHMCCAQLAVAKA